MDVNSLLPYARQLSQFPANENARSNLALRLQLVTDTAQLKDLAREFMLSPVVSVMIWRRLAALAKDDPAELVEAARELYANSVDDEAITLVEDALSLNDRLVAAWELKAALTPDPEARKRIYDRILVIDPGNRRAVDSLIALGR